jgi:CBS domain-containing protein
MIVKNIMTPADKLIIVSQMDTIEFALKKMKEFKIKSVIVEKHGPSGAYGLLTFKNILQAIVAEDGDMELLSVYDLASTPAISVSSKMDVKYAAKMMINSSIKRLLVIDDNEIMGIISMTDIVEIIIENT